MSRKSRQRPERTAERMRRMRSGPIEPIVIDTTVEREQKEPILLFTIDGENYFMDSEPSPALALRMLEMTETDGESAAMSYVLHEVLGDEGYDALKTCEAMTGEQFTRIVEYIGDHVMGALDAGK